jgi:biotin carboxylase
LKPPPGTEQAIDPSGRGWHAGGGARGGAALIVKAAGGGGGIGMVRVDDFAQLAQATATCFERATRCLR